MGWRNAGRAQVAGAPGRARPGRRRRPAAGAYGYRPHPLGHAWRAFRSKRAPPDGRFGALCPGAQRDYRQCRAAARGAGAGGRGVSLADRYRGGCTADGEAVAGRPGRLYAGDRAPPAGLLCAGGDVRPCAGRNLLHSPGQPAGGRPGRRGTVRRGAGAADRGRLPILRRGRKARRTRGGANRLAAAKRGERAVSALYAQGDQRTAVRPARRAERLYEGRSAARGGAGPVAPGGPPHTAGSAGRVPHAMRPWRAGMAWSGFAACRSR